MTYIATHYFIHVDTDSHVAATGAVSESELGGSAKGYYQEEDPVAEWDQGGADPATNFASDQDIQGKPRCITSNYIYVPLFVHLRLRS